MDKGQPCCALALLRVSPAALALLRDVPIAQLAQLAQLALRRLDKRPFIWPPVGGHAFAGLCDGGYPVV